MSNPLSRRTALGLTAAAALAGPLARARPASAAAAEYVIRHDQPRQVIWGLGVELQFDSIGSGNNGLPEATTSVPHDLVASERTRFYRDMLKVRPDRGFRYCRLALGLYLRGLTTDRKRIVGRWSTQMAEIRELITQSGMEGVAAEYWSPAPAWKSNNAYVGGTIASTDAAFLAQMGDAMVADIAHLKANGIPVKAWGLQNEPHIGGVAYSSCTYTDQQYHAAFKAVAAKVRAHDPTIHIHADSNNGQYGRGGALIRADATALSYVDAWTYHRIGQDSNNQLTGDFTTNSMGRPVYNNEYEYLSGGTSAWRMVNTAQSIMNWMTFQGSPTWYWLHALKPTYNSEAAGYALGFWRPYDDDDFSKFGHIAKGHWDYNRLNWHSVAGFVQYLPWDSRRYHVDETTRRTDQRIMAWKTPQGKLVLAFTNRGTSTVTHSVDTGSTRTFHGQQYTPTGYNVGIGTRTGPVLTLTLPPTSIQFWIENV